MRFGNSGTSLINMCAWNHIILEGFCTRTYSSEKNKYVYKLVDLGEWKTEKIPNPEYNKEYKTPRKPKYCKDKICQACYFKSCPHLAIGEVPIGDYKKIMKKINEVYK